MGSKVLMVLLLLALALVAESTTTTLQEAGWGLSQFGDANAELLACSGGHCHVEDMMETFMDSETNRRQLAGKRYISYGALKANSVPCNRRGQSYYNCQKRQKANPYRRGCSAITNCYRYTG